MNNQIKSLLQAYSCGIRDATYSFLEFLEHIEKSNFANSDFKETEQAWKNAKEELPENCVYVLIARRDGEVIIQDVAHYDYDYGQWFSFDANHKLKEFDGVIAWMPLPEPPNKEA